MTQNDLFAGIDVGTTTTKAVIIDASRKIIGRFVQRSGTDLTASAMAALEEAAGQAGIAPDAEKHR